MYTLNEMKASCDRCINLVADAFKRSAGSSLSGIIDVLLPLILPIIVQLFSGCVKKNETGEMDTDKVMAMMEKVGPFERLLIRKAVQRVLDEEDTPEQLRDVPVYKIVSAFADAAPKVKRADAEKVLALIAA